MNHLERILSLKDPMKLKLAILHHLVTLLPGWLYLTFKFRIMCGVWPNIRNPKTFNEKLQWLKLYDHNPLYTTMVDKFAVKDFVAKKIGQEYVIPTLGVWSSPDDIDFGSLPQKFVLKTTHGGGGYGVLICKDKSNLNIVEVKKRLKKALRQDIAKYNKEWPYKNVPRRIIAEEYLEPNDGEFELYDYKVLCFCGQAKLIEFHSGRHLGLHTQDFYDTNWVRQDIEQLVDPLSEGEHPKPEKLDEMVELSNKLSEGIPHCRVDWYYLRGNLLFGEITFYDGSGMCLFTREEDDLMLGSWIIANNKK